MHFLHALRLKRFSVHVCIVCVRLFAFTVTKCIFTFYKQSFRTMQPARSVTSTICLAISFLLFISGCATKRSHLPPAPEAPPALANAVWNDYLHARTPFAESGPFQLTTSLRYSTPDTGHRVVLRMWGNGNETVRFDLESGIGTLVARIRSGPDSFIAYSPSEKRAVVHTGAKDALLRFGVPVPFSVRDLMYLLRGQYSAVFGNNYQRATLVGGSTLAYTLSPKKIGGTLILNKNGLPAQWLAPSSTGENTEQWRVEFSRYTEEGLPGKVAFRYADTHKAIFLHRKGTVPHKDFSANQLELVLPPDTVIKPLRQHQED